VSFSSAQGGAHRPFLVSVQNEVEIRREESTALAGGEAGSRLRATAETETDIIVMNPI
jgi:hypothetical protein